MNPPGNTNGAAIKYYQKLDGTFSTSGVATGTFTLPSDYDSAWKIYIIAEDINAENETDFASEPVLITLPGSSGSGCYDQSGRFDYDNYYNN